MWSSIGQNFRLFSTILAKSDMPCYNVLERGNLWEVGVSNKNTSVMVVMKVLGSGNGGNDGNGGNAGNGGNSGNGGSDGNGGNHYHHHYHCYHHYPHYHHHYHRYQHYPHCPIPLLSPLLKYFYLTHPLHVSSLSLGHCHPANATHAN